MKKWFLIILFSVWTISAYSQDRSVKRIQESSSPGKDIRIALVIGNSNYKVSPLRNPVNDAQDIARVLKERQFDVTLLTDSDQRGMVKAIRRFGKKLKRGEVGLFYYAGHGMQVNGRNYLIPVGANISEEHEVSLESVDVNRVLGYMANAGNRLNMVILDACRDNPFARSFRSSAKGLAQMDAPAGTLIAYATAPGKTAADGSDRNGIYTKHLLKQIQTPSLEISQMFRHIRAGVQQETGGKQVPWESTSLGPGNFYFTSASYQTISSSTLPPPPPPSLVGHLQVNVNRLNSKVYLNNTYIGTINPGTPLNHSNVPVGKATVKVEAKGYEAQTQTADIQFGQWSQLVFVLSPAQEPVPPGFVLIQPGTFQMGTKLQWEIARPVHTVRITKPFLISDHEVTVAEYRKFIQATGHREPVCGGPSYLKKYTNWGKSNRDNHPVNCITWKDTQAYIDWLNKKEKSHRYRLPTEAEWEYAARSGTKTEYYWGNDIARVCDYGNIADQSIRDKIYLDKSNQIQLFMENCDDGYVGTAPIKSFQPNSWGVYDMIGNVYEYVQDCFDGDYYKKSPSSDPLNNFCSERYHNSHVTRGGGIISNSDDHQIMSTSRTFSEETAALDVGFRIVKEVSRSPTKIVPPEFNAKGFVLIQPGSFQMGSNDGDNSKPPYDEKPAHTVRISEPFYISDHEVTVGEYRKFVKATNYKKPICGIKKLSNWLKKGVYKKSGLTYRPTGKEPGDYPINCVSWEDTQAYITWLNSSSSLPSEIKYRLCAEAEWEYAVRAGTSTTWYCGNDEKCINNHEWTANTTKGNQTHPVKTKKPNPWGIYDMQGNVAEWMQDRFCSYTDSLNHKNERQCSNSKRVLRGNSIRFLNYASRSSMRDLFPPGYEDAIGFRLCADDILLKR